MIVHKIPCLQGKLADPPPPPAFPCALPSSSPSFIVGKQWRKEGHFFCFWVFADVEDTLRLAKTHPCSPSCPQIQQPEGLPLL